MIKIITAKRWLIVHQESDSLFEVFTDEDYKQCMNDGADDVTDNIYWENKFLKQLDEKLKGEKSNGAL